MEFGDHQLQIFTSLFVTLGAAGVALLCDFLKRSNEQLREEAIELKARQRGEARVSRKATPSPARRLPAVPAPVSASIPASAPSVSAEEEKIAPPTNKTTALPDTRRAMARSVLDSALERASAFEGRRKRQAAPEASVPAAQAPAVTASKPADDPVRIIKKIEVKAAAAPAVAKKDWAAILRASEAEKPAPVAVMASAESPVGPLPAGFQRTQVLARLLEKRQLVSGLVISIGVTAANGNSSAAFSNEVEELVRSLMAPKDFAAQRGPNEFILIAPGELGAPAQRRLTSLAQRLWDFRLRSLGSSTVSLSWGGVEVRGESIEEAIASASDRMLETERSRQLMEAREEPLQQAV